MKPFKPCFLSSLSLTGRNFLKNCCCQLSNTVVSRKNVKTWCQTIRANYWHLFSWPCKWLVHLCSPRAGPSFTVVSILQDQHMSWWRARKKIRRNMPRLAGNTWEIPEMPCTKRSWMIAFLIFAVVLVKQQQNWLRRSFTPIEAILAHTLGWCTYVNWNAGALCFQTGKETLPKRCSHATINFFMSSNLLRV